MIDVSAIRQADEPIAGLFPELGYVDTEPRRIGLLWERQNDRAIARRLLQRVREELFTPLQLRPALSNASTASVTGAAALSWTHTGEAGKAAYVLIAGQNNIFSDFPYNETVTFQGRTLSPRIRWAGTGGGFTTFYLFTLEPAQVVSGADTIAFTGVDTTDYSGLAFNVANGPIDGSALLAGAFSKTGTSLTKTAYAWDSAGLQVAVAWTGLGVGAGLSGGTTFATGGGLRLNTAPGTNSEMAFTASRVGSGPLALLSFLIPSGSQPLTNSEYPPYVWFTSQVDLSDLAPGAYVTVGLPYGTNSGERQMGDIIGHPGTIHSMALKASGVAGAGDEVTVEILRGRSSPDVDGIGSSFPLPTGVDLSVGGAIQTQNSLDEIGLPFYRYESLSLRYTNTGATNLPSGFTAKTSLLVESGTGEQTYGGGAMLAGATNVDEAFRVGPLHPDPSSTMSADQAHKSLWGMNARIVEMIVPYQSWVTVDPDHEYFLEVWEAGSPVRQDGSSGTVNTGAVLVPETLGESLARKRFALNVDAGQYVSMVGYVRDAASDLLGQACIITVRPDTPGDQMISGHASYNSTTDHYVQPNAGRDEWGSDEAALALIIPPMTAAGDDFHVRGVWVDLEPAGPGSSKEWRIALREDEGDTSMPVVSIVGAAITGQVAGDVVYDSGSRLSLLFDAVNAPSATRQFWTLTGRLNPPEGIGPYLWIEWPRVVQT